jgi:hypothetical protein
MNGTTREKFLLTLFPTVMIALLWWGWFRPNKQLADVTANLTAAKSAAPSAAETALKRAETDKLQAEVKQAEDQKQQAIAEWEHLRTVFSTAAEQSVAMNQVTDILREHQLKLIEGKAIRDNLEGEVGRALNQLMNKLNAPPPGVQANTPTEGRIDYSAIEPETTVVASAQRPTKAYWKIEFAGSYADVLAALHDLRNNVPQAVPIQIRMAPAVPNLKTRLWTLILAI